MDDPFEEKVDAELTNLILGPYLQSLPKRFHVVPTFDTFLNEYFQANADITPLKITVTDTIIPTEGSTIGYVELSATSQNPHSEIIQALHKHFKLLNTYTEEVNRTEWDGPKQIPMEIHLYDQGEELNISILWNNNTTPIANLTREPENGNRYVITATGSFSADVVRTVFDYVLKTQDYQANTEG